MTHTGKDWLVNACHPGRWKVCVLRGFHGRPHFTRKANEIGIQSFEASFVYF